MNTNAGKPQNGYISVEEVLKYKYIIPTYQRGYRWDKDNVSKLLEDIYEDKCIDGKCGTNWSRAVSRKYEEIFHFDKDDVIQNPKQAYCIQPLVVCPDRKELDKFDVIDGQQRLTTIAIIICALKNVCMKMNIELPMPSIQLSYESRPDSGNYLYKLWNNEINDCDSTENVDYWYIMQAYDIAFSFYEREMGKENCNCKEYARLLKDILLKNTRFIWYCIDQDKMDPHEVFANFNTGKIELTNAELVKALFMDASNYDNVKNIKDIEDKRIVISEKWDEIETSLHNPDFWAFVPHRNQYEDGNYDTRIDVIFEMFIMMHHINAQAKTIDGYIGYRRSNNRDRYIFDEMESYIQGELEKGKSGSKNEVMQKCWGEIRKVYLGLQELYQVDTLGNHNNKIYNMVGLYINLANRIPGRVDAYLNDQDECYLRIYYNLAEIMKAPRFGKDNRKTKLQQLIKKEIGLTEDIEREIKRIRHSNSNEAGGAVDKEADKIVKILLAYNIGLLNQSSGIGQRFDFRAFANITWQREHIFATNIDEAKNQKEGLDMDEERIAALKILSEDIQMIGETYKNKYIEYVRKVYFHKADFPPKFKYENDEDVELDFNNEAQVKAFIGNNLSREGTGPFSMLAKALDAYHKSTKLKQYYDKLEQMRNAQTYDDENIKRQMYYRILTDLGKDFYTREYVDIESIVEKAFVDYPNQPQYNIKVGEWSRTISDNTRDKRDLTESVRSAYSDYVRSLYMENQNGSGRADDYEVKKYEDVDKWEALREVFQICEKTLQENIETFFSKEFANLLVDNTMGNMTLLTGGNKTEEFQITNQNQQVTNKSFKLKKQMIHTFFQEGEFVPLGTVLVFSDAYNDGANTANFWLPDSRIRYLDNMISTLESFLQNEEN